MKSSCVLVTRLFGATALLSAFLFTAVSVAQAIGAEITINAPSNGQTVSGKITVAVTLRPRRLLGPAHGRWNQRVVRHWQLPVEFDHCRKRHAHIKGSRFSKGREHSNRHRIDFRRRQEFNRKLDARSYGDTHALDTEAHASADLEARASDTKPHA